MINDNYPSFDREGQQESSLSTTSVVVDKEQVFIAENKHVLDEIEIIDKEIMNLEKQTLIFDSLVEEIENLRKFQQKLNIEEIKKLEQTLVSLTSQLISTKSEIFTLRKLNDSKDQECKSLREKHRNLDRERKGFNFHGY